MSKSKIAFFLSGSIAAFKACEVLSALMKEGHEVQTVITASTLNFIGRATLEGLTNRKVLSDLWEPGEAMQHIHITRWCDFGILCPASAQTLSSLAHGQSENLVTAALLAWPKAKALHIFPAMNAEMYSHPATKENLQKISRWPFVRLHECAEGDLACGETGPGRLLEPEQIVKRLTPAPSVKVLITSGATREPVDGIRFLSNVSTGQTGAHLAEQLWARGFDVTYLAAENAAQPAAVCRSLKFSSFASLNQILKTELAAENYAAVVHAAAVSDYSVDQVNGQPAPTLTKLSSQEDLRLSLKRNFKILPRLKDYSKNPRIRIIGFKLTLNERPRRTDEIANEMLSRDVDAVVANDWSQLSAPDARTHGRHPGRFITGASRVEFENLTHLAELLNEFILSEKGFQEDQPWSCV